MDALLAAIAVAFGLIGVAAWRNLRLWRAAPAASEAANEAAAPVRLGNGLLLVAQAARAAFARVQPEARQRLVRLEMAVPDDLLVRLDAEAFDRILSTLLLTAIRAAPAGRVLLTARRLGGRVEVAVAGDGGAADRDSLVADLRPADELLALHGGTLEVQCIANAGAIFVARLLEPQGTGAMKLAELPQHAPAPSVLASPRAPHQIAAGAKEPQDG
ncbi:MAG: hypothetical protein ACREF1_08405 [Acetobacteraceae bacterium]